MDRKEFLKLGCNACILGAAGMLVPQLIGCGTAVKTVTALPNLTAQLKDTIAKNLDPTTVNTTFNAKIVNGIITMPLHLFTINKVQLITPDAWDYQIAVHQKDDATYNAILLKCTHYENQLLAEKNDYTCILHGSTFNKDGKVLAGPAEENLKSYKTVVEKTNLLIII